MLILEQGAQHVVSELCSISNGAKGLLVVQHNPHETIFNVCIDNRYIRIELTLDEITAAAKEMERAWFEMEQEGQRRMICVRKPTNGQPGISLIFIVLRRGYTFNLAVIDSEQETHHEYATNGNMGVIENLLRETAKMTA